MATVAPAEASARHLAGRLGLLADRVALAVARRRSADPDPDDRFRGLYVSDAQVDELLGGSRAPLLGSSPGAEGGAARLAAVEATADADEAAGGDVRLRGLGRSFDLDPLEIELLLVALAPDLDTRFERLFGYLHDDVSRRRASVGLALELAGVGESSGAGRARFGALAPLVAGGLLVVEDPDRPFLTRALRVPDRVAAHLLGDDSPDPAVEALALVPAGPDAAGVDLLAGGLGAGARLAYVRERIGTAAVTIASRALERVGRPPVVVDLGRLAAGDDPREAAAAAIREARLRGTGLVAGPLDLVAERGASGVRAWAEAACTVVLHGTRGWDPAWSRAVPFLLDAGLPSADERRGAWLAALAGTATPDVAAAVAALPYRLAPEAVVRAAEAGRLTAAATGRELAVGDVAAGARAQNAAGLERLARRVEPRVGWSDLVLQPGVIDQLHELTARARHRDLVLDEWGMARTSLKGRGVTALFAGDSGTGKTMSAEVIAGALGLDLYVIDLSTVVDKYIGETEKNLDRVFTEADRVNGVLLFDEADAIFGKRSEVKDARDRYANVEVAYLLQRMEMFDGMAVLTTNLRANVDEAFLRRLDAIVDFPMPDVDDRRRLWVRNLSADAPTADDIDHDFLARRFTLSGGNIRNVAVGAAFRAADAGRSLGMEDLVRETAREYRKLGRLCVEAEFGPWFALVG